ncbi:hypothetical protein WICPIJ_009561 [Wickerhamomyces pijperi]|uniref:Major facilitator superfamily (MFS) profile domain-containing protein n=1 Tax=Wickerhamomyces pijperi TaxID=599730 RepID=A0A9P8TCK8_WICPI|nr:hypothetical protein WICPIJ_009561 [Wickerhamomyces pijperi]
MRSTSMIQSLQRTLLRSFIDPTASQSSEITGSKKQSQIMPLAVGLFAATGGFIYGYDTGIINSISEMQYVRSHFASNGVSFSVNEASIMVAILSLGTFFGAIFAPLLSDTIGRKYSIIFSTFGIFMIGNVCQIVSNGMVLFCIGRFITGVSVGLISAVVPLYQAEASPKYIRGAIISTYQWAITWGLLVSSAVSQGTRNMDSAASFRIPVGLQFVWSMILGCGMLMLPDTPRFFVLKDDLESAAKSLARLRRVPVNDPALIEELVEIKASHDYELSFGSASLWDCFRSAEGRPHQFKRMITGIAIQTIQQCSGINFIFYYGNNFFSKTGVVNSSLISFVTYAVNVLSTVPGILLVEIIGRRKILIFGGIIMTISNFIIGIVGVTTNSVIANKVMIAFVCLFIASFAASWGPVVWVVVGEIYSLGVRGKAVALSAATNWLVNFTFAFITPYLVDTGNHTAALGTKIFFIWGGLNLCGVVFVYLMVYETKGLSLEQINELYRSCNSAIESKTYSLPLIVLNVSNESQETDTDKPGEVRTHGTSVDQRSFNDEVFSFEQFQRQQRYLYDQQQILERMMHERDLGQGQGQEQEQRHDSYELQSYPLDPGTSSSHQRYPSSSATGLDSEHKSNTRSDTDTHTQAQAQAQEQYLYQPGYTVDIATRDAFGHNGPPSIFTNSSTEEDDEEADIISQDLQGYLTNLQANNNNNETTFNDRDDQFNEQFTNNTNVNEENGQEQEQLDDSDVSSIESDSLFE